MKILGKIFMSFSSHSTKKPQVRRALAGGFAEKQYCKNFYPWSPQAGADERGFRGVYSSVDHAASVRNLGAIELRYVVEGWRACWNAKRSAEGPLVWCYSM